MNHASGVMGCVMMVSGGFNTEAKVVMDDFNLFDFRLSAWVPLEMHKPDGSVFRPHSLYDNDIKRVKDP